MWHILCSWCHNLSLVHCALYSRNSLTKWNFQNIPSQLKGILSASPKFNYKCNFLILIFHPQQNADAKHNSVTYVSMWVVYSMWFFFFSFKKYRTSTAKIPPKKGRGKIEDFFLLEAQSIYLSCRKSSSDSAILWEKGKAVLQAINSWRLGSEVRWWKKGYHPRFCPRTKFQRSNITDVKNEMACILLRLDTTQQVGSRTWGH